ncbi:MAG: thiamine pyrophosphate-binding protein [Chloroflexi bacterium]|nr:thiamine pyrophosphate-binding protein [Chloroflexota bacterium]
MIKLSDYVMKFVIKQGVKHIFLIAGGGAMHLINSAGSFPGKLEFVANLHEQAAAIGAHGYGHLTGNLGVALVTTGPGGTNAITGVAGAWMDSTPMMVISGQVKRSTLMGDSGVRSMGSQEVDNISIVKPITKYAVRILEPETIRYHLEKAVHLARTGRQGPVWIDIPQDVQAVMIDEEKIEGFTPPVEVREENEKLVEQIKEIIRLVNKAERPVLLAGYGVQAAGAAEKFKELIDLLQIPVLTTWKAIGLLPEDHPLYAGRPGSIGQRGANFTQQNSDLLISIGARLDYDQVAFTHEYFAHAAKKIVVDIDPAEIKKLHMDLMPVVSDAGKFINTLLSLKNKIESKDRSVWLKRSQEWRKKYPVVLPEFWKQTDYVNMYVLMDALSDEMEANEVIVPGSSGPCANIMMQAWRVKDGQKFVFAPALGAMGFGLPHSIGACLASGRRRTVCVNGDGGFQLNIQELETVARLQLPIKFFVLANGGYGSIMAMQRNYFNGHYVGANPESGLTFPDITKVAKAYGIPALRVKNHKTLREKIRQTLATEGPVICEVSVSPLEVQQPRVMSSLRADGTIVSKPMEDLWPFLEREEFYSNMIVPPLPE